VDTGATLQPILNRIFVGAGEDLRAMVPNYWRSYLEGSDLQTRQKAWRATLEKDANPALTESGAPPFQTTVPRALHAPDPKYSKEAAKHHIEGVSRLGITVDGTGRADNIAILDALGMGLDEQAVLAVKEWKFRPALKDGQPVRVQILIEITFRCCPLGEVSLRKP
jgi:TonB family protein